MPFAVGNLQLIDHVSHLYNRNYVFLIPVGFVKIWLRRGWEALGYFYDKNHLSS